MQRLAPLPVSFLVTVRAIRRLGKSAGLNKCIAFDGGVPRRRNLALAEMKTVSLAYPLGVALAVAVIARLGVARSASGGKNTRKDATERPIPPSFQPHLTGLILTVD